MKLFTKKKNLNLRDFLEYLIALYFILEVNTVFFKLKNINLYISETECLFILILFAIGHTKIKKKDIAAVFAYEIYAIIYAFIAVRGTNIISYGVKFLFMIPVLALLYGENTENAVRILKKFSTIMVFLSVMSLLMYLASYVLPPFGTVSIEWGNLTSAENYIFFFSTQKQEFFGQHILRNTGIFCEAPMYGFCLSLALSTQLFFYRKIKMKNVVVLCVTILSTFSATAVFLMCGMLVVKYYYGDLVGTVGVNNLIYHKRRNKSMKYVLTFIGVVVVAVIFYCLANFKLNTGLSYSKRIDDYIAAFHAWKQRPVWGIGYGNGEQITNYMAEWRIKYSSTGFSNAVMVILSTMGIYGSVIYLYGFFKAIVYNFRDLKYISLQCMIALALLFVTVVPMQLVVLNYIAIGIGTHPNPKNQKSLI